MLWGVVAGALCLVLLPAASFAAGWSIEHTADPARSLGRELYGVSWTSGSACTAVGNFKAHAGRYASLAERWNGNRWSVQPTPSYKNLVSEFNAE
jgi:hypothetical protein